MKPITQSKGDAKLKTVEEVKSLIVGTAIHLKLKNFCKENGLTIRPWVEKAINEALQAQESRN